MKHKLFYTFATIWSLLAATLFIVGITPGEPRMGSEMFMTFLGFPFGLLIPELLMRVFPEFGSHIFDVNGPLWQYIIEWFCLFLIGIMQWFVMPYWVSRKFFFKGLNVN